MKETLILTPLVAVSTYCQSLFAEGQPDVNTNVIVGLIGNAGIVGALIWYMWHRTTKSDPAMLKTFADQLEAERKSWEVRFEEQRTNSEARHEKTRETFEKQVERMRDIFEKQVEKMREATDKERQHSARETAELRGVMLEMARNMRVAVHDIKDSANAAILKSTAGEERARQGEREAKTGDSKHG